MEDKPWRNELEKVTRSYKATRRYGLSRDLP